VASFCTFIAFGNWCHFTAKPYQTGTIEWAQFLRGQAFVREGSCGHTVTAGFFLFCSLLKLRVCEGEPGGRAEAVTGSSGTGVTSRGGHSSALPEEGVECEKGKVSLFVHKSIPSEGPVCYLGLVQAGDLPRL